MMFCGNIFAQTPLNLINKSITPVGKNDWRSAIAYTFAKGDKITVVAEVENSKKNFGFCITMFPGNQPLFVDMEATKINYEFEAPMSGAYVFWDEGRKNGKYKLKIDRVPAPNADELLKDRSLAIAEKVDTLWNTKLKREKLADTVIMVPRVKKVLYQTKTASEIVYNEAFAVSPSDNHQSTIVLPYRYNDEYQVITPLELNYTITVDNAVYQALVGQVTTVIESGIDIATGSVIGKIGGANKADESLTLVNKMARTYDKVDQTIEIVESSAEIADISQNGVEQEAAEGEMFVFEEGKLVRAQSQTIEDSKTGTKKRKLKEEKEIKINSMGDIAGYAANKITPNIKEKIKYELFWEEGESRIKKIVASGYDGFTTGKVKLNDKNTLVFRMNFDNTRGSFDGKSILSSYIFGTLTCEYVYKIETYKDVVYFDKFTKPVYVDNMENYKTVSKKVEVIFQDQLTENHHAAKNTNYPKPNISF